MLSSKNIAVPSQNLPSISEAVLEYLRSARINRLSMRTQEIYGSNLHRFYRKFGARPVDDLRRSEIQAFLEPMTPSVHASMLGCIKVFYSYAVDREYLEYPPTFGLKAPAYGTHRVWAPDEIKKMLAASRPQVRTAILLALYTGQRISDILNMKAEDIFVQDKKAYIQVKQKKTGMELVIPLHKDLDRVLPYEGYLVPDVDGTQLLFQKFRYWFQEDRLISGCTTVKFHGLRKTCASRLAEEGATLDEIMAIGGWRSYDHVAKYTSGARQKVLADGAMAKMASWT